ncbi:MAG: hypothetical protein LBK29_02315 [Oscillospiraceae bacterium]|jgi:hypothetical protein|nr:hypothetical protein [Oscillospiraceae bacterium]
MANKVGFWSLLVVMIMAGVSVCFAVIVEIKDVQGGVVFVYNTETRTITDVRTGTVYLLREQHEETLELLTFGGKCVVFSDKIFQEGSSSAVCELEGSEIEPVEGCLGCFLFAVMGTQKEVTFRVFTTRPRCESPGSMAGANTLNIPSFAIGGNFVCKPGMDEFREIDRGIVAESSATHDARFKLRDGRIFCRQSINRASWLRSGPTLRTTQPSNLRQGDFQMEMILQYQPGAPIPTLVKLFAAQCFVGLRDQMDGINDMSIYRCGLQQQYNTATDSGRSFAVERGIIERYNREIDSGRRRPGNYRDEITQELERLAEEQGFRPVPPEERIGVVEYVEGLEQQQPQV